MAQSPKVRLRLKDVFGDSIQESVTILFRHQELSDHKILKAVDASKTIDVLGLRGAPRGFYRVEIDPPSYLPVSRFMNVPASGLRSVEVLFPVDPPRVTGVKFPAYTRLSAGLRRVLERSKEVLHFEGRSGKELYDGLDPVRKAGLLNIAAKSDVTALADETTVLPAIEELYELRGDRFFAKVPKTLREEVKNSVAGGLFDSVSGALHHPPEGFSPAGSFKTPDSYGNLQLTFFMKGNECRADIDIDDAAGLGHVFQVLRNTLTGRPTHPYDIHQILFAHQQIDAGYRFQV